MRHTTSRGLKNARDKAVVVKREALEADGNMYAVAKQARVIAAFPRIFPIP
jgi:hypothetical protein